jgi:hypothetical protein
VWLREAFWCLSVATVTCKDSLICSKTVSGCCDDESMTGDHHNSTALARAAVADARREAAAAMARLAEAAVRYADCRIAEDTAAGVGSKKRQRATPGEFIADELSLLLRDQPYPVRCLLARSRRIAADLPTVWEAFQRGELDAEQIRVIDRVARKVTEASTLAAIDDQVVDAAQTKTPKQLQLWLLRLMVRLEPLAFAERHRRALADRRVSVVQGVDGIGYVTGEVSAADAAAIDGMLAGLAAASALRIRAPTSNAAPTCSPTSSSADSPSTTTPTRTKPTASTAPISQRFRRNG